MELTAWYGQISALVVVLFLWFYWKFMSNLDYWKKKGAIYLEASPFFGNVKDSIMSKVSETIMYEKLYWKLDGKPYGGVFHLNSPCLLIRDQEIIKDVLVKNFASFHDRGFNVDEKLNPLGAHLFQLSGKKWRNLRVKLTPTFTSGKLKVMFPILVENANIMLKNLENKAAKKETLEVKEIISQLTTDIICSCAFGIQTNSQNDSNAEFRKYAREILTPSFMLKLRFLSMQYFLPLLYVINAIQGNRISEFFLNAVKDMVQYREKNNVVRNDFLQLLIQLKNKGNVDMDSVHSSEDDYLINNVVQNGKDEKSSKDIVITDALLAAQCFVFFVAGFETSSTTVSYALHELAINQDIQERLREEVDCILQENNGAITYDALQKMEYLERVVDETLRKYPPVGKLDRICTEPYRIPETNVVVDKGTRLAIPVYAIHHDSKYYPDPERFDPDRFTAENKSKRSPYVYLPFGEGPRICIGMRFGLMQSKMALAALISKYKFTVSSKTVIPPEFETRGGIILTAKGGVWLTISKRD